MTRIPEPGAAAARRGPKRAAIGGLATLLLATPGLVCGSPVRVTNRPPDPILVDARGEVDRDGFDALVAAVESRRELAFIQRPRLELLTADDPRLPSLRAAERALEPCGRASARAESAAAPSGSCFPDPSLEWVVCVPPPDMEQARRALRRLLDAQNYPRLARAAPVLAGDPGVALRALLAASANGAQGGAIAADPDALDLLELAEVEVERQAAATEGCVAIAGHFLSVQEDREAPFRRPPLSTKQLVSPKRYRAGERPERLLGAAPEVEGCTATDDESVGVARLLVEVLAQGGPVPGPALAGWQGDRGVRFACEDESTRWIYAAELSDAAHAAAFAAALPRMLPDEFPEPSEARTLERRVVVTSQGFDARVASAWVASLATESVSGLDGID